MEALIRALEKNGHVFRSLLENTPKDQFVWREQENKWSLLEIVCHLSDEEREDFRMRIHSTLEDPVKPWPKIDPLAWVTERHYSNQNFGDMLIKFLDERHASVEWLSDLSNPQWDNAYQHPKVGPVSARFLMANWVAHDYLHIRQINRVKYNFLKYTSGQELDYAGQW